MQNKFSPTLTSTTVSRIKTHLSQVRLQKKRTFRYRRLCYVMCSTICTVTSDRPHAWPLLFEFDSRYRYFNIATSSLQRPINSVITREVLLLQTKDHSYSKRPSASNKATRNSHVDQVAEKQASGEPWFRSQIVRKFISAMRL